MKDHELGCLQRNHGVRTTLLIAKFYLENLRSELLDDGTYLPAAQPVLANGLGQGHHIE